MFVLAFNNSIDTLEPHDHLPASSDSPTNGLVASRMLMLTTPDYITSFYSQKGGWGQSWICFALIRSTHIFFIVWPSQILIEHCHAATYNNMDSITGDKCWNTVGFFSLPYSEWTRGGRIRKMSLLSDTTPSKGAQSIARYESDPYVILMTGH